MKLILSEQILSLIGWLVGCLTWSSATMSISRTGSKTYVWQFYVLPHGDKAERRWLLSQPVTVYRHRRNHKRANGAGMEPQPDPESCPTDWATYKITVVVSERRSPCIAYTCSRFKIFYIFCQWPMKKTLISYAIVPTIHHIVLSTVLNRFNFIFLCIVRTKS